MFTATSNRDLTSAPSMAATFGVGVEVIERTLKEIGGEPALMLDLRPYFTHETLFEVYRRLKAAKLGVFDGRPNPFAPDPQKPQPQPVAVAVLALSEVDAMALAGAGQHEVDCPDDENLWTLAGIAARIKCGVGDVERAAGVLGVKAKMSVNGFRLLTAADANRIGEFLTTHRAAAVSSN